MVFFSNKRKDFSIQPPKQEIANGAFSVIDSANIDFTYANNDLTANLTQTGIVAGTYGDATHIPILVLDIYGRVTGISTTTFSASGISLETNGTPNGNQTLLNLVAGTNMTITDDGLGNITFSSTGGGGSGTVTSVSAGTGMNFTTITTSGSVAIDTTKVPYLSSGFSNGFLTWNGSAWVFDNNTYLTTSAAASTYYPIPTGSVLEYIRGDGTLATFPTIPTVGSWGALNYPTWVSGTPFVKMTAAGTFALDNTVYFPNSMTTNRLLGRTTAAIGVVEELTANKSVVINAGNVELTNDETSPTARKFYSASGTGVKGWRFVEKLDLPVAVQNASYPYVAQEYISGNLGAAIIKIPGSNVIFSAYTTGNQVIATNSSTGATLSTTTVTGAIGLVYVALTGEVWAFGSSAGLIYRFNATTGVYSGSSTAVTSLTASCRGVYDDSLVTGNVFAYNGTTMNVINASTYARTGVSIAGSGSGSNELTLCTSGTQSGLLIGTLNTGIFGFNKSTNTSAFTPNSMAINYIKWVDSLGAYVGGSIANNTLNIITPTSSTALSITSTLYGILTPYQFVVDETEDRIFAFTANPALMQKRIYVIELSSLSWIKVALSTTTTSSSGTFAAIDTSNKTIYAVGTSNGGSIAKIVYG